MYRASKVRRKGQEWGRHKVCTLWLWPSYATEIGISLGTDRILRMLRVVIKSNHQDWIDEDWSYNGCMFTVGTSGECVCSNCAMRASCNGFYEGGCASTGRSTDNPQLFNSCRHLRLVLRLCRPLLFPAGLPTPLMTPVSAKSTGRKPLPGFCLLLLNLCCPPSPLCIQFVQNSKAAFSTFYTASCAFPPACSAFDAVVVPDLCDFSPFETKII